MIEKKKGGSAAGKMTMAHYISVLFIIMLVPK